MRSKLAEQRLYALNHEELVERLRPRCGLFPDTVTKSIVVQEHGDGLCHRPVITRWNQASGDIMLDDLDGSASGSGDDGLAEGHRLHEHEPEGLAMGGVDHDIERIEPGIGVFLMTHEGDSVTDLELAGQVLQLTGIVTLPTENGAPHDYEFGGRMSISHGSNRAEKDILALPWLEASHDPDERRLSPAVVNAHVDSAASGRPNRRNIDPGVNEFHPLLRSEPPLRFERRSAANDDRCGGNRCRGEFDP